MRILALLMTAAGLGLSLLYSGLLAVILEKGTDYSWILAYDQMEPALLCVLAVGVLAIIGILFALCRKKFGAFLLVLGAVVVGYYEFGLGVSYPYSRATAILLALAALCSLSASKKSAEEEDEDEEDEDEAEEEFAAEPAAAPADEPVADAVAEALAEAEAPAPEAAEPAIEPAAEPAEEPAVEEPVAEAETSEPKECPCKKVAALLVGLASAAWALYSTGLGAEIVAAGSELTWLASVKEVGMPAEWTAAQWTLFPAVLAVIGALFACAKKRIGALILLVAAALWGYAFKLGAVRGLYFEAAPVAAVLAALIGLFAAKSASKRRYTAGYILAAMFAVAGVIIAVSQSGFCVESFSKPIEGLSAQLIAASVGLGALGAVLSLLGFAVASLLLLVAMFATLAGELLVATFYPFAWAALVLFALAAMLSAAKISTDDPAPQKRLTVAAALVVAILAAVAGGAVSWCAGQAKLTTALNAAVTSDPAYQKVLADVESRDAKIAELEEKLSEQSALVAERDATIDSLNAENGGKAEEIAAAAAQNAERDEKIAALQSELDQTKAKLAEVDAASAKKYIFLRGTNNVRNVSNSDKGSKVIGQLTDEAVEMLEIAYPKGKNNAAWYKVKGKFGTGWVWGKNAVELKLN